jgi:hypothetical protein
MQRSQIRKLSNKKQYTLLPVRLHSFVLQMKTACPSRISVSVYQTTRRNIQGDSNLNSPIIRLIQL